MKIIINILSFSLLLLFGNVQVSARNLSEKALKVIPEPTEMLYRDFDRSDKTCAKDPTVIRIGDDCYMYYSIPSYSEERKPEGINPQRSGWHSGIARSTDMIHWQKLSDVDLRSSTGEEIGGCVAPCVKILDGVIHMFYQKTNPETKANAIWHATSKDGIRFVNTADEPVFCPQNAWASCRAIDAEVYRVKDKLVLMYVTRDKESERIQMVGMAEAPYGSDYGPDKWTDITTLAPLMKPEYQWEGACIEAPTVYYKKGVWYMFYAGSYNHEFQQIGLAVSCDGYNFSRVESFGGCPGLFYKAGEPGSWNQCESGHPGVFEDNDGKVYLFYQGKPTRPGAGSNYSLSVLKLSFSRQVRKR